MDGDLNRLRNIQSADEFISLLDEVIASELTNDFWSITLPSNFATSSARNPELFAYVAAQNRLGAPVLFSHKKIADLIDPSLKTKKKALERHHLFPKAWLLKEGVEDRTLTNQIANYALLEWPENIDIRDNPPHDYVPSIRKRFSNGDWEQMVDGDADIVLLARELLREPYWALKAETALSGQACWPTQYGYAVARK